MTDENGARSPYGVVREWMDFMFVPGDLEEKLRRCRDIYTEDCLYDDTMDPDPKQGIDAVVQMLREYFEAFPDMTLEVEEVFETEDTAVCVVEWSATHAGEYSGRPASGKRVTARNVAVYRCDMASGRIHHHTLGYDNRTVLDQIDA